MEKNTEKGEENERKVRRYLKKRFELNKRNDIQGAINTLRSVQSEVQVKSSLRAERRRKPHYF